MGILHCMGCRGIALLFITITLHLYYTEKLIISDEILPGDTLWQGFNFTHSEVLTSKSEEFKLEFFPLPNEFNGKYYLGIKWKEECIWLAYRDNPVGLETYQALLIDDFGNMEISYNRNTISIYSSEAAVINHTKIIANATLTNSGSFELSEMYENGSIKQPLWTSFDYPNNILLPEMKLGFHKVTGKKWNLTSWAASLNPALGSFTLGIEMDSNYTIHLVLRWRGNPYWTGGPLVPLRDTGFYCFENMHSIGFLNTSDENEISLLFADSSIFLSLNPDGELHGPLMAVSCNSKSPVFIKGCKPPKPPKCRQPDAYVSMLDNKYGIMAKEGYKINGTENLPLYDCGVMYCLMNCSCQAYSFTNDDGTGCQIWDYSINFEESPNGQQIYFIQDSPKGNSGGNTKKNHSHRSLMIACVIGGALLIFISAYICHLMKKRRIEDEKKLNQEKILHEIGDIATPFTVNLKGQKLNKDQKASHGIHIFSFETIVAATDNFSLTKKLGEGGFGPVYKGKLADGQEIAVKRLSKSSRQGLMEFKNEIKLIAKLQHTNLVRLCGFCFEGEENMLIYEYMPNKSLDFYLFDSTNRNLLDWKIRYNIIQGIAQGLVYLHKFSRLRVIHRDLKPSNILLDYEMNPKISDFGLARIFGSKESEQNASRLVGTYGYMSPEYAFNGIVSIKTDVFSFGVVVLEIVSGQKNTSCFTSEDSLNLIGFAWKLWNESRVSQLVDPIIRGTSTSYGILRCIHIGLLCVQDQAKDRPTMLDVVSFLSNETILLAEPKQPAFFIKDITGRRGASPKSSINDVTISDIGGR